MLQGGSRDCDDAWGMLGDKAPCGTMLDPDNSEADRQLVRGRIVAFNTILENLTSVYAGSDDQHYGQFSDTCSTADFDEDHVSEIDCFHPGRRDSP